MKKRNIKEGVEKEKSEVLVVYYGKEEDRNIEDFLNDLKEKGFSFKITGPINSHDCPWAYIYLNSKKIIIGKPGIDFAPKRYIEHSILINDFKYIYNIYCKVGTLDNKEIYSFMKKYKHYSIFCYSFKEDLFHKINIFRLHVHTIINSAIYKCYYDIYIGYKGYKKKVLICMMKFQGYKNKEEALNDYKFYEDEILEDFKNKKQMKPASMACYIRMA